MSWEVRWDEVWGKLEDVSSDLLVLGGKWRMSQLILLILMENGDFLW